MLEEFPQENEQRPAMSLWENESAENFSLASSPLEGGAPPVLEDKKELKHFYDGRYEVKFIVHPSMIPQIRDYIRPFCELDENCRGSSPPEYRITTLQLDSPDLALHYAKLWDFVDRFKLRVRTYDPVGDFPVFLEVKAKFRTTVVKYRSQIPFECWGGHLFGDEVIKGIHFQDSAEAGHFFQFIRLTKEIGARPVMLIRYNRESYFGKNEHYARVTFDRRLQYQQTYSWDDWGRKGKWRCLDKTLDQTRRHDQEYPFSGVVVELKSVSDVPTWMRDLIKDLGLTRQGHCKFSNAIWAESIFRNMPWTPEYEIDYHRYL